MTQSQDQAGDAEWIEPVVLDGVKPHEVFACMRQSIDLAYQTGGDQARISFQASWVDWLLQQVVAAHAPAPAEIEGLVDAFGFAWGMHGDQDGGFKIIGPARKALLDAIARLTPPAETRPAVPENESLRPGIEAAKNVIRRTFTRTPEVVSELVARFDLCLSRTLATPHLAPETTDGLTRAAADVLAERHRQVEVEGWTVEHDDAHFGSQIARAAACYCLSSEGHVSFASDMWRWDPSSFKPTSGRHDLVKAGALILAEIERLDRAEAKAASLAAEGERT